MFNFVKFYQYLLSIEQLMFGTETKPFIVGDRLIHARGLLNSTSELVIKKQAKDAF